MQCLKLFSKTGSQIPIVVRRQYIKDFVDRVFYINTNVNNKINYKKLINENKTKKTN
jgi:hypothetical protein